jgi:dGTPase
MMDWGQLLNNWRMPFPDETPGAASEQSYRSHFESDYDRIVYSQPFRRLARKTQVHPMTPNDHVHNRLTHSIEVASVGRSFARRLGSFLNDNSLLPADRTAEDLGWVLMASCAAHDIGNPPFGHAGESAIRDWTEAHQEIVFPADHSVGDGTRDDVLLFEGNAQGFRIAARNDNPLVGYLRLTYATLGAMVKYPWDSSDPRAEAKGKHNCFSTEASIFCDVFRRMGLVGDDGSYLRHPLSFLSEAADDICYRVIDLEDAAELRIISEERVRTIYGRFLGLDYVESKPIPRLRGEVIARLIEESWRVFEDDYDQIMRGDRKQDLKSGFDKDLIAALEEVQQVYGEIFAETSKVAVELGAYKTLGRILKALCTATAHLARQRSLSKLRFVSKRCLDLAWPRRLIEENTEKPYEWWLHQVLDYVSALTDNMAKQISRDIHGI